MSLLDSMVGRSFRDEKAGRVVVFTGDRRNRGYVARSESEELKIRPFLKMFYFAHLSILLLGRHVSNTRTTFIIHLRAFGRQDLVSSDGIYRWISSLIVGLLSFLLWRSYKRSL